MQVWVNGTWASPRAPATTRPTSSAITPLVCFCPGGGIVAVKSPSLSLSLRHLFFHASPWKKPQGSCLFKNTKTHVCPCPQTPTTTNTTTNTTSLCLSSAWGGRQVRVGLQLGTLLDFSPQQWLLVWGAEGVMSTHLFKGDYIECDFMTHYHLILFHSRTVKSCFSVQLSFKTRLKKSKSTNLWCVLN